jgi:YVTN family beta-propeller protein
MKISLWKVVSVAIIVIFAFSTFANVHATATQLATPPSIHIGKAADCLAYDSGKGEIFVTDDSSSVSVISDSTNTVVATIAQLTNPCGVAYDSGKGEVFVICTGAYSGTPSTVAVISDSTNTVVANITVGNTGDLSYGIAYDSGKGEIFVVNSVDNTVSVISDSTNTVVATITVGNNPYSLVYDSGKGEILVTNEASSSVSVISDSNNQVVATITSSISAPEGIAYDPAKGEIFVADYDAGSFSVISDKNNAVTTINLETAGAFEGLGNPHIMGFDSGTGQAFLNCNYNAVNIISDKNNAVVASFAPTGSYTINGFAYDSGKGEMFIASEDNFAVYYLSDSSSPSASSTPSPSPTVPEFGGTALIMVVAAMVVATCAVAIKVGKRKQLR